MTDQDQLNQNSGAKFEIVHSLRTKLQIIPLVVAGSLEVNTHTHSVASIGQIFCLGDNKEEDGPIGGQHVARVESCTRPVVSLLGGIQPTAR